MNTLDHLFKDFNFTDIGLLTLRLTISILVLAHGLQDITHIDAAAFGKTLGGNLIISNLATYCVFIGDLLVPTLLALGIFCRLSAAAIIGNMLFIIVLAFQPELFSESNFGGYAFEMKLLLLVSALPIALLGSGRYAVIQD
ncbi:DoxX family protein [Agarilytica rhodophyticola]|uniref:DoxX family protein n=1 Tax=Agarilytica rhodophyticola TaxID=1737490 RepID=UPI000B344534|nr:DoxX family protein [Agarilytica rhodophyticola]